MATWSASITVESRWAMRMVVRPWRRRRRACCRRASVTTSRFEVASSRTSRAGSAIQARANETSWRSPADSLTPRSPISVSRPLGRASVTGSAPTARTAAWISARVASGRPKRMLSATVAGRVLSKEENRNATAGSGEGEEQPLQPGLVDRGLLAGRSRGDALLEPAGDELEAGAVQRAGDRGELGDDVGAVAAVLQHADDAPQLALGAAQPLDRVADGALVELHASSRCVGPGPRSVPGGTPARSGSPSRT